MLQWGGALRDDTKNGCVADYKTSWMAMLRVWPPTIEPVFQRKRLQLQAQGLFSRVHGKTRNIAIQLVLQLQNKLHVFCCRRFTVPQHR